MFLLKSILVVDYFPDSCHFLFPLFSPGGGPLQGEGKVKHPVLQHKLFLVQVQPRNWAGEEVPHPLNPGDIAAAGSMMQSLEDHPYMTFALGRGEGVDQREI